MFDLYPHQADAVEEIIDAFSRVPVVVLDGPTGSGKTVVGDAVRRGLGLRAPYVCSSKSLQDQFIRDFPTAAVLKGRANYNTERYPELYNSREGLSCADCTKTQDTPCDWCHVACPYQRAKDAALGSDCAVLNTTYWLTEANGPGGFRQSDLVIIDECDLLEQEVMRYASVKVSDRTIERYKLGRPQHPTKEDSWQSWIKTTLDAFRTRRHRGVQGSLSGPTAVLAQLREARHLQNLTVGLRAVAKGLEDGSWTMDGRYGTVEFKPVLVDTLGERLIWNKAEKFLLMSATVISSENMLRSLGYNGRYETVTMPSTFPVENRRVRIMPVGEVKGANKDGRIIGQLAAAVDVIAKRHPTERILVHTVSHALAGTLLDAFRRSQNGNQDTVRDSRPVLGMDGKYNFSRLRSAPIEGLDPDGTCGDVSMVLRASDAGSRTGPPLPEHEMCQPVSPRTGHSFREHDSRQHPLQEGTPAQRRQSDLQLSSEGTRDLPVVPVDTDQPQLARPLLTYAHSADKARVVAEWEKSNGILFAASLDRGIDLVGDRCRVQVIAKIPYPNLGDKQVSKRLHTPGGQVWYTVTTIRTVVQMAGRIVRTADDHGTTYILDSQFGRLWRNWRGLFPEWFQEAVQW